MQTAAVRLLSVADVAVAASGFLLQAQIMSWISTDVLSSQDKTNMTIINL